MHSNVTKLSSAQDELTIIEADELTIVRSRLLYERRFKRLFDIVGGLFFFVATLPIIVGIALAVRLGLGKGVLYSQRRIGQNGEPFTIYKFRTMRPDRRRRETDLPADSDRRSGHKDDNDPRHTGLGRLLRRMSLDELPQLVNVIRGEMSLVGPRPELVGVASKRGYLHHPRHEVRPGMTGPYQTSLLRLNGDLRDGLHLDQQYVNNLTFRNDLRYLIRTVSVMLGRSTGS